MPYYKGTLLFNYTGSPSTGFSESHEFFAATDSEAKSKIAAWPAERRKWLAQQWRIVGFRLSAIALVAQSGKCVKKYKPIAIGACVGTVVGLLGDADSPYTGVLVEIGFDFGDRRPRNFIARGVPDGWWTGGALSIPVGEGNRFLAWFNFMRNTAVAATVFGVPTSDPPCSLTARAWNQYCVKRIASRRIGRPFGLLRGRRSKKAVP